MYSFIILNYYNVKDTIECLESLKKLNNIEKANFIVVDNNTLTEQEYEKINVYTKDVLKLDKNYGFANANNKGINYAKNKYNSSYYIVINNDVIIKQKEFLNIIDTDYQKYNFDMLGPKIDSPTGDSVNPFPVLSDKEVVESEIIKCNKLIKIYNSTFLSFLLKCYIGLKHIIKKPKKVSNGIEREFSVPLHGCALVFSKKYIDKYDSPFDNRTFLFHEEEFLYQRVIKNKLVSIYEPDLYVFHKEGSSMNKMNKKEKNRKLFREKERLKSLEELIKEM